MPTPEDRAKRRHRHAAEIEESQARLRASIAETERLVGESDEMLRRHRHETEEGDSDEDKQPPQNSN
jgi:hypothetical protein